MIKDVAFVCTACFPVLPRDIEADREGIELAWQAILREFLK